MIAIYTDGACRGNPGPGGWGVFITEENGEVREIYGGEANTTNNRMELKAAIEALHQATTSEAAKRQSYVIHTDSEYVRKGITEWMTNWKKNGWKTAARKPVKNADLWQELDALNASLAVEWRWVKGHAGVPGNEAADRLANLGVDQAIRATG